MFSQQTHDMQLNDMFTIEFLVTLILCFLHVSLSILIKESTQSLQVFKMTLLI